MTDEAFEKGAKLAREGMTLEQAKTRCPYQHVRLRAAFVAGWSSVSGDAA